MKAVAQVVVVLVICFITAAAHAGGGDAGPVPGVLYVKFAGGMETGKTAGDTILPILAEFGAVRDIPAFPLPPSSAKLSSDARGAVEALSRIHRVDFPDSVDLAATARALSAHPDIEYAEPLHTPVIHATVDDPAFTSGGQQYLSFVSAPGAWDIATGSSDVVVGIVDTGTEWQHPDLNDNLWENPDEIPGNDIDDDGNGYVDDVRGWDFFDRGDTFGRAVADNDPRSTTSMHGTHVAGIAAAVTDNGTGVASLSHNVRFMPVKVSRDGDEGLPYAYEGVVYAVSNGADVVNCSWGSPQFSQTGRQVMDYAASMDVLVTASAGNSGTDVVNYPAGYAGVMAVASVDLNGGKSAFSNYGSFVDISAPGNGIYSATLKGSYAHLSGTSMSAPLVAALAALIRSHRPGWDSNNVRAQIFGTASPLEQPAGTTYLCGCGYINAALALGNPVLHMEVVDYVFDDDTGNNDNILSPGETVSATLTIRNLGDDVENLTVQVNPVDGHMTAVDSLRTVDSLGHGESVTLDGFRFTLADTVEADTRAYLRVDFASASGSINFATIDVTVNRSYATLAANTIELSLDNSGHIGHTNFPQNTIGTSFVIHKPLAAADALFGTPLLFEGGLLAGTGPDRVSDTLRGADISTADNDFDGKTMFAFSRGNDGAVHIGHATFTDGNADTPMNIEVNLTGYAFSDETFAKSVILAYTFTNAGSSELADMRAGLFFDFDLPYDGSNDDYGAYNAADDILFTAESTVETGDRLMVGATMLDGIGTARLIDNTVENEDEVGLYDGFTTAEKWASLSAGTPAGFGMGPTDISMVVSAGPHTLAPGDSVSSVYIVGYGEGYDELRENLLITREFAESMFGEPTPVADVPSPETFRIEAVYPNPFNPVGTIGIFLPVDDRATVTVYDILGRRAATVHDGYLPAGRHTLRFDGSGLASGVYFFVLESSGGVRAIRKATLLK